MPARTDGERTVRAALAFFAVCAVLISGAASAQSTGVADRVAEAIRTALPGSAVTVPDPGGVEVTYMGQTRPLGIASVQATCDSNAAACAESVRDYAQRAVTYMLDAVPLSRDQLRAVVRSHVYVQQLAARAANPLVEESLAGELEAVCFQDLPRGRRPIMASELPGLTLAPNNALAACRANSRGALPPLAPQWHEIAAQQIGVLHRDDDVTAYLLAPQDWRALSERMSGLIVAVPSADTIIYAHATPADIDALSTLARQMQSQADTPISAQVFHWTAAGWVCVSADCAAP